MINPIQFANDYKNYNLRNQTNHSIESDGFKSYHTTSNFYTNKSFKKFKSLLTPYSDTKLKKKMITVGSMKDILIDYFDKQSNNFERKYSGLMMIKESAVAQIKKYELIKTKLLKERMESIDDKRTADMLIREIARYKNITDKCKQSYIELSFEINELKKELDRVIKKNNNNNKYKTDDNK